MPSITNQEKLFQDYVLEFVSKGPTARGWEGHYLKCPICGYYVKKGRGYDECLCGNISIDSDMLRVTVEKTPERGVETYFARKRIKNIERANTGRTGRSLRSRR